MAARQPRSVDWKHWLLRWDSHQAGYVPKREERFDAMLDVLASLLPEAFLALDLACGPGAISQRLLERFPSARCIAVDMDPVMLALGKGALGTFDGRLTWVDADLASSAWLQEVGESSVDAALSTTALHWLLPAQLVQLYEDLGSLIRPGGVFLNGDNLDFGPHLPSIKDLTHGARDRTWSDESFAARGIETSEQWWASLGQEPSIGTLIAERNRRLATKERPPSRATVDLHVGALRDAGFREVTPIWQSGTDYLLMAVR